MIAQAVFEDLLAFGQVAVPGVDGESVAAWAQSLRPEAWWRCEFRNCDILPVVTENGGTGKDGTTNRGRPWLLDFVEGTDPVLRDYCEAILFPWLGMRSRVNLIRTAPGGRNHVHIDCSRKAFGTRQHKFRQVLKGRTDSLYFLDGDRRVYVPNVEGPFVMDGAWPHGMDNKGAETKITLAVGSPWCGNDNYKFAGEPLKKSGWSLPADYDRYFEK